MKEIQEMQMEFEKSLGPLDIFSCGAVTGVNDYVKFVSKAVLIEFGESSKEVREAEKQKMEDYLKNISFTTADCMFNRFEVDPIGM